MSYKFDVKEEKKNQIKMEKNQSKKYSYFVWSLEVINRSNKRTEYQNGII